MKRATIFLFLVLNVFGCSKPTRLEQALDFAGENRSELERVLNHYPDDSKERKAAEFLISNMIGKGSVIYHPMSGGKAVSLDRVTLTRFKDVIRSVSFGEREYSSDLLTISSDYLIENIDLAFLAREKYSWCKALPFDQFCEKVLPYRVKHEPLDNWRRFYYDRYHAAIDSLSAAGVSSIQDVVFYINSNFGKSYIGYAGGIRGEISLSLIEHLGGGTCDHLALNALQVMRAFGIPLNFDVLPYHGKVNGGHAYNSFTDESGKFIYFSPYERSPERNLWIAPLVMRVNFRDSVPVLESNGLNAIISSSILENVTNDYYETTDISLDITLPSEEPCYLAVFNRGSFKVVHQSYSEDNRVDYKDVTCGLLYFPMVERGGSLEGCGSAFIVGEDSEVVELSISHDVVELDGVNLYDGVRKIAPSVDDVYTLLAWDGVEWQNVGGEVSRDSLSLSFGEVSQNSLFLVSGGYGIGRMQRPFIKTEAGYVFY